VDGGPVGGHVDHGPFVLGGGGEDLAGAAAQDRITVVGVFPVAVGVVDDQLQGPAVTNSTIDCLALVTRQPANSSALIARLLRLILLSALSGIRCSAGRCSAHEAPRAPQLVCPLRPACDWLAQ
jgi:hypothetical protein